MGDMFLSGVIMKPTRRFERSDMNDYEIVQQACRHSYGRL